MKSVGESMGIGRTFAEAFDKARRGLEIDQAWQPENLHPVVRRASSSGRLPTAACRTTVYRRVDSLRRRGRGGLELLLLDPRRARRGAARSRAARS